MTRSTEGFFLALESAVRDLKIMSVPDEEMPDTVARLKAIHKRLGEIIKGIVVEMPADIRGKEYYTQTRRKARRTYNTSAILAAVANVRDMTPEQALRDLLREDAVRLNWRWSDLSRYFERHDIELRQVSHEIANDGTTDGPQVGAQWESEVTLIPIPPEGDK